MEKNETKNESIRFENRVAIVTGAGAGLGRAYAVALGKRGAKVVVNDLGGAVDGTGGGTSAADKVVEEIKALGGEAVSNYDSVSTSEGGQNITDTALKAFGRVDILVNNAGILRDKTLLKTEPGDWQAVLDVHLTGAYNVTRPALANMRENKYGRIVFTTSAAGLYGNFGQSNYSSAKIGLIGLMNCIRQEMAKYDIKINTVAPVAFTRMTDGIMAPERAKLAKPEAIAPLVLYFCSDQCADTGLIMNAGAGCFSRAAIVTSPAIKMGETGEVPTVEDVAGDMEKLKSMEGAVEYPSLMGLISSINKALGIKV